MKWIPLTAAFFIAAALCFAQTLPAQKEDTGSVESAQAASGDDWLRAPPADGGPVVVRAAFYLQEINEIDDVSETFEFTGVLSLYWQDKRQSFDPADIGTNEKFYQGYYQFNELSPSWYPQVILANASGLFEKDAVLLRVKPDGACTLVETINAIAESKFDLRRYPFDRQRLELNFQILGFDSSEVLLEVEPMPERGDLREIRIPQWALTGIVGSTREMAARHVGGKGTCRAYVLNMDVRRQSLFMLRLVVLPLVLIVILSWSVFWMDRSSLGDRMSISFVGILTAVAYQIVLGDMLAHISYVTLINGFLNISFLFMCCTIFVNLLVGALDKRGNFQLGDQIDHRCRYAFPAAYFGLLSVIAAIAFIWF
jgi:hypothetical protein